MYKIRFFDKALYNIKDISSYISLDNPFYSKKVIENIYSSISYLQDFPYLGKEMKDGLRLLVSKHKYSIVYKVENEIVYIVSIFKYKDFL